MSASRWGERFVVQTFGESHGTALGAVIDGCPAGVQFDPVFLALQMQRRRPGFHVGTSARQENDEVEILSGVFNGFTLGTPIAMMVRNQDARSVDYNEIQQRPRAGHADDVWKNKFGISDHRGGGRSSGRETVARVMGGSVAQMFLKQTTPQLRIRGYVHQMGEYTLSEEDEGQFLSSEKNCNHFALNFPSAAVMKAQEQLLQAQKNGESWGGSVRVVVENPPAGLGQPVFHKLKSDLAAALMSIGATSGFELGAGTSAAAALGTDFHSAEGAQYGGVRGGISTGDPLVLTVYFKPTSSILDVAKKGRHDPCIVIRAVAVVESMVALVLADHFLWSRTDRL